MTRGVAVVEGDVDVNGDVSAGDGGTETCVASEEDEEAGFGRREREAGFAREGEREEGRAREREGEVSANISLCVFLLCLSKPEEEEKMAGSHLQIAAVLLLQLLHMGPPPTKVPFSFSIVADGDFKFCWGLNLAMPCHAMPFTVNLRAGY